MEQSSERIASMDLSGAGACEWYSIISCPAKIMLEYMSIPALTAKYNSPQTAVSSTSEACEWEGQGRYR